MSGQINSIIAFFVITFGLGYTVFALTKATKHSNPFIFALELLAIGLGTFSFLGVVLNLLHIPLHISVYIVLAMIGPVILLVKLLRTKDKEATEQPRFAWSTETICVFLLILVMIAFFAMYLKGANTYPYLEDDDPWNHAQATMYVATTHAYTIDPQVRALNSGYAYYLEPYPPTYDTMMGILRQFNDSVVWTLKFFNVLLITLGLAFLFLLTKQYLKSSIKAIFAVVVFASLPSFMSHFIWSQTLALVLFPVALYAVLRALEDDSWRIPAIVMVASEMVTQPVVSFVFGLVIIMLVILLFLHEAFANRGPFTKRFSTTIKAFIIGAGGLLLSFLYWGYEFIKWGAGEIIFQGSAGKGGGWMSDYALQKYDFLTEIVNAPFSSRIDQAVGFGLALSIFLGIAFLVIVFSAKRTFSLKKGWLHLHMLLWLVFLGLCVFGPTIGVKAFGSSRFWPYLAIPLVLFTTEGLFILIHSITKQQLTRIAIVTLAAIAIVATGLPAKIAVQTATWNAGAQWTQPQIEISGYLSAQASLPKNSRLYAFCGGDQRSIGFDMLSEPWSLEQATFRHNQLNMTGDQVVAFLKKNNFAYITIDATCVEREWDINKTTDYVNALSATGHFKPIVSQPGFLLAQVQ